MILNGIVTQPIGQNWNYRGVANNMVQRVRVVVS